MIELGMHVDNWRHSDVSYDVPCEFARKHGLKYVEFGTIDGDYFIQALGYNPHIPLHTDPLKLKKYLDSLGLKVSQIDAAYPISTPEGQYRGVPYTLRSIQFAKALGARFVDTTDGARKPEGYTDEEVLAMTRQNFRQILEWADDYGIIINVEPHGPYTTDPDTVARILGFFDSPRFGMNLDTGNTFIAGQDPVAFAKRFRDRINHVHVKDVSQELAAAMRGEETGIASSSASIGKGVNAGNIEKVLKFFKETRWDGVLSVETLGTEENIRESLGWLRKVIAG